MPDTISPSLTLTKLQRPRVGHGLVARLAISVLALAMALTTMGLADSILLLAFGVALAIGLAFSLGGREAAVKQVEQWQVQMKNVDQKLAAKVPESPETPAALDQPQA